jgi:hypothetical protein
VDIVPKVSLTKGINNMIPIPFLGWIEEDKEDTEQMLRDQIHIQQKLITMLEEECSALRKQAGRDEEV